MKTILMGLLAICFATVSYAKDGTEGHGGDPLHFLFEDAKVSAAARVRSAQPCSFSVNAKPEVRDWILRNKETLARDIEQSRHIWITDTQTTCAFTQATAQSDITLSYNACRSSVNDISEAALVLIHESVHHLGITNEHFPDEVALAVHGLGTNSSCPVQPSKDPFDPASCPGTAISQQELMGKIPLPNTNTITLGQFQVVARARNCYAQNWCSGWVSIKNSIMPDSKEGSFYTAKQDGAVVAKYKYNTPVVFLEGSRADYQTTPHSWIAATKFDGTKLNVSSAYGFAAPSNTTRTLLFLGEHLHERTSGIITNNCLRMTATAKKAAKDNLNNDIIIEFEGVILSNW